MRTITDFFHRPAFSQIRSSPSPPEQHNEVPPLSSSPLSDPPSSSALNQASQQLRNELEGSKTASQDDIRNAPAPSQSFRSIESTAGLSAGSGSFNSSQRILKDGKEVVTNSDGEDTDSINSLDDPAEFFKPRSKPEQKQDPVRPDTSILYKPASKYKNTLDSLVYDAVDDNEIEASVAKVKATFAKPQPDSNTSTAELGLHKGMLTSALGDNDEGSGLQRLMDAVRRTEALEQDRVWHFFDHDQKLPPAPDFPRDLFPPGTHLAMFREPESRERAFQSGIIEFAFTRRALPNEFVKWIFQSISSEPRIELRQAYGRMLEHTTAERVAELIGPDDMDDLFRRMGAKPHVFDFSQPVKADPPPLTTSKSTLKDRAVFLSVLKSLNNAASLFGDETREQAIHLLLRLTLDTSLTADALVCAELESAIDSMLRYTPEVTRKDLVHRICTTVYETVTDVYFQSRILQHILPTSDWIALLRCRLAVAFLLQTSSPLTEPPEVALDLKRITVLLLRDQRFNMKRHKMNSDYDYGELSAIAVLLNVAIDSSLFDVKCTDTVGAERDFDAAIDKLATQVKKIFSAIEDSGASHLKRMLAKEALEALHYRMVYAVRSRPPPKKTLFRNYGHANGNIQQFFKPKLASELDGTESPSAEATATPEPGVPLPNNAEMPIREHEHHEIPPSG
ncbi:hypothetical protein N7510_005305 [Penicillium lagena]|uniref:uncharacterized protein n=1 Tax=Penicillium lagena TaxID=94218 RepID=UPI00254225C4|nr:uncharacterized protein N7510_005305 [Penicillium lagena]KAJ5612111.1 hypothetical protein N7510_005305 [Penicillium lagena]